MRGDINEKLKCAFEIYDLKGDGKIDKREMKKTLNSIYDMLGEDNRRYRRNSKFAEKKVELIFQKYDTDKDNKLSLDEFINGCLNDEYLNQLLKSNFIMSN
jgi:Ca2+-binding EF-hand superfamily protein